MFLRGGPFDLEKLAKAKPTESLPKLRNKKSLPKCRISRNHALKSSNRMFA
jgi:hypothetical protein